MHGRKKVVQTDAERKIQAEKAATYAALVKIIMERRSSKDMSQETLVLTEKLIKNNPDFYILWNFRRDILIHSHGSSLNLSNENQSLKIQNNEDLSTRELNLSTEALRRNPKSYCAWFHRKWIFTRFAVDPQSELTLTAYLLKEDQRNFHCWNYRRFVAQASGASTESELEFSSSKIKENFSNYSAFHHRSLYIQKSLGDCATHRGTLVAELAIVESAVFTEPDDQSAWWYHQFLLGFSRRQLFDTASRTPQLRTATLPDDVEHFTTVVHCQLELLRSLLEFEAGNKWAMVSMAQMTDYLCQVRSAVTSSGREELQVLPSVASIDDAALAASRAALLNSLVEIDASHKNSDYHPSACSPAEPRGAFKPVREE
ncbi:unnamed protein product [Sphagnum balticum]